MDLKDKIALYKEFYFKEQSRKIELDSSINLPIIIVSSIVSINSIVLTKTDGIYLKLSVAVCFVILVLLIIGIIKIIDSYSNKGNNYIYRELNGMDKFYLDEKEKIANGNPEDFDLYLEKEFAECAGHNFQINVKRTELLATGKQYLYICLLLSISTSSLYIISELRKENFKHKLEKAKTEQIEKATEIFYKNHNLKKNAK